jgi:hypothetical protein
MMDLMRAANVKYFAKRRAYANDAVVCAIR